MGKKIEVGDRTVCVKYTDMEKKEVEIYGHGVIVESAVPSGEYAGIRCHAAKKLNIPMPVCQLDSGELIYSKECYFFLEQRFNEEVNELGLTVIPVDINTERKKWNENNLPIDDTKLMGYILETAIKGVKND